jgi:hypothetical protein
MFPKQKQLKVNKCITIIRRGKWIDEALLKKAMDAIESGKTSLRQTSRHWNKHCTFLSNHLNGKTKSKKGGLAHVLIEEKK